MQGSGVVLRSSLEGIFDEHSVRDIYGESLTGIQG